MTPTDQVRDAAERAEGSDAVGHLARVGLAARTVVWFMLGVLVVQLALGRGGEQADQSGALKALAGTPFGGVLLTVLLAGFLIWAGYCLLAAAVGHREHDGDAKRWAHRAKSAAEGLLYLAASVSTARVLVGGRSDSEQQADSVTAAVMSVTGGRSVVGLAGVAVVCLGIALAVRALKRKHAEKLEHSRIPASMRRPVVAVGVVGLLGRAGVVTLVGGFLVNAAVQFDPEEAKGLDASLRAVADQPFGPGLLAFAALGILGYALWSLVETLWRDL